MTTDTRGGPPKPPTPELTLSHLDSLPTLAPIAVKLLQVTADAGGGMTDVIEALRGDQSLTAKILSVANSVGIGARRKVPTLERAVVLLGFKAIRSIVLTVKVFECLATGGSAKGGRHFERAEFWKHSLAVACAARRLASRRPQLKIDPEEAFVAGLLHDLGKVALDAVFPKAYERVAREAAEAHCDIADCERTMLGVDHTVAGRHLAKRWGLPRTLQDAIWLHHVSAESLTDSVASPVMIALIQLADLFVREHHIGHSGNYAFYEPSTRLAQYLGFSETEVEAVARDVVSEVAEQASVLGLDPETAETLYLKSVTRANSELGRLNTDLLATNRRLTAAARYFKAITQFDHRLSASSDLGAVVSAIANAALTALQRAQVAAFGLHDQRTALEFCCASAQGPRWETASQRLTKEVREWLDEPGDAVNAPVVRAPLAVRSLAASVALQLGTGECWLLPIVHDEQIAGGIVFLSERDERVELADEVDELRSFLASLGLALGRANAQAAARRLSEDLAESNRRLQQVQAEVLRTRALSMIAEMASGAGHELNSPLTVISGRAQMLMASTSDPQTRRALEQIHNKAHECARIVTELMDFARPRPPEPGELDLRTLLTEVRDSWLTRSRLPASRFQVDLPEARDSQSAPKLSADYQQILTVLDEILTNAVDAVSENEGSIRIRWQAGIPDSAGGARPGGPGELGIPRGPARWVEITIQDTGCGMTPAVLQRIFDPFFSHRSAGRGRGLGLARAFRIVEAHGGRIWATSQPGEGTSFHVVLPETAAG